MPLVWNSAVINTEKLEAMTEVQMKRLPGMDRDVATVWTEAVSIQTIGAVKPKSTQRLGGQFTLFVLRGRA